MSYLDFDILHTEKKAKNATVLKCVCVCVPVFVAAIKNGDQQQWITDAAGHFTLFLSFSSRICLVFA